MKTYVSSNLIVFLADVVNTVIASLKDKKFNLFDLFRFLPLLPQVAPTFSNLGETWDELRSLTDEDRKALADLARLNLDIPEGTHGDKVAEAAIDAAISVVSFAVLMKKNADVLPNNLTV